MNAGMGGERKEREERSSGEEKRESERGITEAVA